MKGNAQFYRRRTLENEKELRKLVKAKRKYQRILDSITREIQETEQLLYRDMHCLSVVSADSPHSVILE